MEEKLSGLNCAIMKRIISMDTLLQTDNHLGDYCDNSVLKLHQVLHKFRYCETTLRREESKGERKNPNWNEKYPI